MREGAEGIGHDGGREGIAVVTLNNPPVNGLGNALRAAIMEYLKKAEGDPAVKGAVLIGSAKAFSGGADIREFNKPREKPDLSEVNDQQDAMTKPLVAAIGGFALGGGLELALACLSTRGASSSASASRIWSTAPSRRRCATYSSRSARPPGFPACRKTRRCARSKKPPSSAPARWAAASPCASPMPASPSPSSR